MIFGRSCRLSLYRIGLFLFHKKGLSNMINIRSRNDDHEVDIRFPISESELYAKLAEIHAIDGRDAPPSAFVTEVYWPEELSTLKDRFANLDELNYLAKRMESFDYNEYDQFLIGITKLENPTEKDLINLTFNLDHFTLCKDVSSYGKIGREYVLNTEGAVPANDEDDPKYAAIGKDLIDRGLAQITAKGLLLTEKGIQTKLGKEQWRSKKISKQLQSEHIEIPGKKFTFGKNMVMNVLKNEKYCGDCILQKTVTIDCISKTRKKNEGEAPMYIVENSHPAIISREMFNRT